jgi:hypothetical protein
VPTKQATNNIWPWVFVCAVPLVAVSLMPRLEAQYCGWFNKQLVESPRHDSYYRCIYRIYVVDTPIRFISNLINIVLYV